MQFIVKLFKLKKKCKQELSTKNTSSHFRHDFNADASDHLLSTDIE